MRKPLGPTAMDKTLRFRLTAEDMEMLRYLADDDTSLSAVVRGLIVTAYMKEKRRRRNQRYAEKKNQQIP